jgi:hypothetical protein
MDEVSNNPPENRLGDTCPDAALREAVENSGYPVQTVVATTLRGTGFEVAEEWVFTDSDSGQVRALDLYASRLLFDWRSEGDRRVRPELALLIECKRSVMPYVFFESETRPGRGGHAMSVAGLHQDRVTVQTDDDLSTSIFSIMQALGLAEHQFVAEPARAALVFSKAARRNKDVVLSGTDPYQGLVLPLTKALRDYVPRVAPPKTAVYFDLVLPIALAVIDGPMVLATVSQGGVSYELNPWVRVYRHGVEPEAGHKFEREKLYAIDCVHRSWLKTYLDNHLQPFADEFGKLALRHAEEIATGTGFIAGMNRDSYTDLEKRLRPRRLSDTGRRPATFARNLRSLAEETRLKRSQRQ